MASALIVVGIIMLAWSADRFVDSAAIAAGLRMPPMIGLTIVAIGTSLPELVASVVSVMKHEDDLAVGNTIGSNMFNLLAVLAMPALIQPSRFAPEALLRDFPMMLGFTIVLFVVSFGRKGGVINRFEGGLLAGAFATYLYLLYLQG